jgi:hypothetical protein
MEIRTSGSLNATGSVTADSEDTLRAEDIMAKCSDGTEQVLRYGDERVVT